MNVTSVIESVGLTEVAKACGVTPSAVHKWKSRNRLPRTEWTGETHYASVIAGLHGGCNAGDLLKIEVPTIASP